MATPRRILIAGGGIAGLTAATALHQRGFAVDLVERNSEWRTVGAGIAVQPNGMRALCEIGLGAAVQEAGAIVRRWLFRDQDGDVLCDSDLEALWGEVGPFVGIARGRLQDALRSSAEGVSARLGTWVTSLNQDSRGVRVELSDGTTDEYDLVVGADGISSTVRQLALGAAAPVYGGQSAWRSLASIGRQEPGRVQFWLGDGRFFGLCPVGDGRTYGFGNVTGPRLHDAVDGRRQRLRDHFAEFGEPVRNYLDCLESDEQIHCGPIEWLELDRWHVGRVVLIGDAAHASSPMMGQGGCLAMEDALVLAEILRSTDRVETALDAFAARRRPRVDWVQQGSRAVADMLSLPSAIRNGVLRERGVDMLGDRFRPLTAPP